MSKRQYRNALFALSFIMAGWLLGTDVATDLQAAASDNALPNMWYGVYETLAILGISTIAGLVGYWLEGIWWAVIAFFAINVFQFVGLFDPEMIIREDWTHRMWAVTLLVVSILTYDAVKTRYWNTSSTQREPAV
jgi:hypothetical protein